MVTEFIPQSSRQFPGQALRALAFASTLAIAPLQALHAVVLPKINPDGFLTDPSQLEPSLNFKLIEAAQSIHPTRKQILRRAKASAHDERIEAMYLRVPAEDNAFKSYVKQIARKNHHSDLHQYLKSQSRDPLVNHNNNSSGGRLLKIAIGTEQLKWIKARAVLEQVKKEHIKLSLPTKQFSKDSAVFDELVRQLAYFMDTKELRSIKQLAARGKNIEIDQWLLPDFAQKMVGKFTIFRGPNCFHSAMAFHGKELTNSPYFNVKEEKGYHRVMINYDELWRILNTSFYEIDPKSTPAEYGDVLIFFDVADPRQAIDFKWIRHAAVYLFDRYTFSKGSKSPDTPYTVKTLEEEWTTWRRLSQNLGVKVYRRAQNHVNKLPPRSLAEWLY